jgi:hypothetical protein
MAAAAPAAADNLPANTYHYLIHSLDRSLPSLPTDSPEDTARRLHSAIERIASLCPANAAEADIATLYVAASEQAKECFRLAQQPDISFLGAMKCRTQASSMMREARGSLNLLLRMQAARQKTEADSKTRDRAAWTEHTALNLMTEALSPQPAPIADLPPRRLRAPSPKARRPPRTATNPNLPARHNPCPPAPRRQARPIHLPQNGRADPLVEAISHPVRSRSPSPHSSSPSSRGLGRGAARQEASGP